MNANEIARQRCEKLLRMAAEVYSKEPSLSKRYVSLARKIAMRHRFSLGNKSFCKKCFAIFIPGTTLRVRIAGGLRIYTCANCGSTRRFPYKKGAKEKTLS